MRRSLLLLTLISALCLPSTICAQGFTYAGLDWGSGRDTTKKAMAAKGYSFEKRDGDGDLLFKGTVLETPAMIWEIFDGDHLVKTTVTLVTADNKARTTYATMLEQLTSKYGAPDERHEVFVSPYYAGDGYEDQAIRLGKGLFLAEWKKRTAEGESLLGVYITERLTVGIDYESPQWAAVSRKRTSKAVADFE